MKFDQYDVLRSNGSGIISYGLFRRSTQLLKLVDKEIQDNHITDLRMADFGCYDGAMMKSLSERHREIYDYAIGLDLFPHGKPSDIVENQIRFLQRDLWKEIPYPLADNSFNLLIASAFFKHHRDPKSFLQECCRVLTKDGILIMLDPCPWVVKIGFALNYFIAEDNPNLWNRTIVENLLKTAGLENLLFISSYERYWVAPNKRLYSLGLENFVPDFLINRIGLHQSIIIRKN